MTIFSATSPLVAVSLAERYGISWGAGCLGGCRQDILCRSHDSMALRTREKGRRKRKVQARPGYW